MSFAIEITRTGGPEVLRKTDRSVAAPGKGEVLIRNRAGAVNFIDTIIRRGEMPDGMMPKLPLIPGVVLDREGRDVLDHGSPTTSAHRAPVTDHHTYVAPKIMALELIFADRELYLHLEEQFRLLLCKRRLESETGVTSTDHMHRTLGVAHHAGGG